MCRLYTDPTPLDTGARVEHSSVLVSAEVLEPTPQTDTEGGAALLRNQEIGSSHFPSGNACTVLTTQLHLHYF